MRLAKIKPPPPWGVSRETPVLVYIRKVQKRDTIFTSLIPSRMDFVYRNKSEVKGYKILKYFSRVLRKHHLRKLNFYFQTYTHIVRKNKFEALGQAKLSCYTEYSLKAPGGWGFYFGQPNLNYLEKNPTPLGLFTRNPCNASCMKRNFPKILN